MVSEMDAAAKAAVLTLKEDSMYELMKQITICYETQNYNEQQGFKCIYLI